MSIFKRAHVRGMVHTMTQQGLVQWPSKLAMDEAADAVADSFPDEEIPEVSDKEGLSEDQAAAALQRIVEVAEDLGQKAAAAGYQMDTELQKQASSRAIQDVASEATIALMEKQAAETAVQTGPDIPGASTPAPEIDATAEGEVDAANNPSSAVVVPQGTTALDTKPGAVGKEERRPDQPGTQASPPMNEASKTAGELAQSLEGYLSLLNGPTEKVAEMDGASLSGGTAQGPTPEARVDVEDNLKIDGVKAPAQGKTVMDVPAQAQQGATKAQPGGTPGVTAPTPNEPAKERKKSASLAENIKALQKTAAGRAILDKIAQSCADAAKKEEEAKMKKEEDDKKMVEEKKEAAANDVLSGLVAALG